MAIFQNTPLLAALFGIVFAQLIKIPIQYFISGKLDWKLMTSTGSMPSSHSAAVTSLTTAIAYEAGLDSPMFAISAIFAVIVMFDATGIRLPSWAASSDYQSNAYRFPNIRSRSERLATKG